MSMLLKNRVGDKTGADITYGHIFYFHNTHKPEFAISGLRSVIPYIFPKFKI